MQKTLKENAKSLPSLLIPDEFKEPQVDYVHQLLNNNIQ